MLSLSDLDPEQRYAIQMAVDTPRVGMLLPMGFGKTIVTLSAIVTLRFDRFEVFRALIVAPPKVAESVWHAEAANWAHTSMLKVSPVVGTPKQRERILEAPSDVYVISTENLRWLIDNYGLDQFDLIGLDEASMFKEPGAKRTTALYRALNKDHRVVLLTGSPTGNNVGNLYMLLRIIDGGQRLGRTLTAFRDEYMQPGSGRGHIVYNWVPKPGAIDRITERIQDVCFSMPPRNDLKVTRRKVFVDIPKEAVKAMRDYARQLKDGFEEEAERLVEQGRVGEANRLLASTAGQIAGKVREMAGGACYTPDKTSWIDFHDCKIEKVREMVETLDGENVVVCYWYQHELARLQQAFPQGVKYEGKAQEDQWNKGKIPILFLHPQSGGHGLNLQFGGHHMIWYTIIRSQELWSQTNMRLPRRGQKNTVYQHHLIARGIPTDEQGLANLLENQENEQKVIDAVMRFVGLETKQASKELA